MSNLREVRTADGLTLCVLESGPLNAPTLVFLHGISMAGAVWQPWAAPLAQGFRLVAPDLRGHGASDKPADRATYQDSSMWAMDVAGILDGLSRPVLVAWSYGGILALDYLRHFGERIAGLVLVGALVRNGTKEAFGDLGPGAAHLQGMMQPEFETQYSASGAFVQALTHVPLAPLDAERLLAMTMMTPPYVRRALAARKVVHDETLAGLACPVLVIQGMEDQIVRAAAGARLAGLARQGRLELLSGVGHGPFLEEPERFGALVSDFATSI